MNKRVSAYLQVAFVVLAAGLLLAGLRFPLWQMRMESPQYRDEEAINVAVYPGALRGDLNEIDTLNQYIGVHVPRLLPQFQWLPEALITTAALGLLAGFLPNALRKWSLVVIPTALSLSLLFAAVQAQQQIYDIGHHRDEKTPLRGVKDFTPPFLGKAKLFQFEVESWFGVGAYLIGGAIALQFSGAWLARRNSKSSYCAASSVSETSTVPKTRKALA
jgi:copper chaperone NosL